MNEEPIVLRCEVQLDPEGVEALGRRLAELMAPEEPEPRREQLMSAAEVAEWWGVARRWIYEHADELGVRRLGSGIRPRLRFDPAEVAESLGDPPGWEGEGDTRRLPQVRGDRETDSLSPPSRAMVGRQARKRPGRRANAPRPGAGIGGAMKRLSARSPRIAPPSRSPEGQEVGDGE
jgi:hypothetical protein